MMPKRRFSCFVLIQKIGLLLLLPTIIAGYTRNNNKTPRLDFIGNVPALTPLSAYQGNMLTVRGGLSAKTLPQTALIIIGKESHLKKLDYQTVAPKFANHLNAEQWKRGIDILTPDSGSVPLFYNLAKVVAVSDKVSRGNAFSNSPAISKELRGYKVPSNATDLSVVVVAEYADVISSVAAVARSFPVFSLKTKEDTTLKNIDIEVVVVDGKTLAEDDVNYLNHLIKAIRETARLIDTPPNILTTDAFVQEAIKVADGLPDVKHHVIRGEELLQQNFGGIYHVGKAGPTPPAFVVLSYKPVGSNHKYALVGKGIVFDTGGMQIKGKTAMPSMKIDMGGAAALLQAFATLVQSGFKQELHVCLCIAENNISPQANKPDDVIRMLSGKTVEINNTDAEGRLVLADGVFYAKNTLGATTIIDMATLTGAQAYISGKHHAAVLTNLEENEKQIELAGRRSGDLVKSMLFAPDMHFSDLKSPIADMRNSNFGKMEGPPSAIAGLFIAAHIDFGEGISWMHLDIASPCEVADRATGYGPALISVLLGKETKVPLLQ
ncbi:unnamed protein product, partial [Mesorhabditis belari]|uniref:Cytosol aminopeptidase domain-containing protein n=1 Tax=Mesorhabditis belari TaxID=2138241 RepID=A0AAF3FDH5_9BILA